MLGTLDGRNGTEEFAKRSLRNLDFVVAAAAQGAEVHPVTQGVTSLLAIFIFPWERSAFGKVKKKRLPVARSEGWPQWDMSGSRAESNRVKTVGGLIKLLRHSVAHGHVSFDSDSRDVHRVTVTFRNYPKGEKEYDWQASIRADLLIEFCRRFSKSIADYAS